MAYEGLRGLVLIRSKVRGHAPCLVLALAGPPKRPYYERERGHVILMLPL